MYHLYARQIRKHFYTLVNNKIKQRTSHCTRLYWYDTKTKTSVLPHSLVRSRLGSAALQNSLPACVKRSIEEL